MPLMMISSGRGPAECELAVGLYLDWLLLNFPQAEIRQKEEIESISLGSRKVTSYRSVVVFLPKDTPITGTVCWHCQSPLRKNHSRKNWYFQVTAVNDPKALSPGDSVTTLTWSEVKTDTFRSPGKGGQNVNKVETGVRLTHLPTGLTVTSVTHRTQLGNKKLAMERLKAKLNKMETQKVKIAEQGNWAKHNQLERGNPVLTFWGEKFEPGQKEVNVTDD
jgi:peptide chain release factor